nr:peptide chain release factor 2 [Oscillatoria laete-virens]
MDESIRRAKNCGRLTHLRGILNPFKEVAAKIDDLVTMKELIDAEEPSAGREEELEQWSQDCVQAEKQIARVEINAFLSGEHDRSNAIVSIHAGAGGTDACDWADLLLRMYGRYAERKGYSSEIVDIQPGDEAGIRSATIMVKGENAYGFLRQEIGVHRLVRISPYNANAARQTSFASVDVFPEIEDDIEIKIEEKDLKIDTYRSAGAGGQHVNKTDSAVRMTHIPTGIIVACQNERSQIKNRATALKILRARLYELQEAEKRKELEKRHGAKDAISFGSQIRSYFFHPYKLVNDHRTGVKISDVQGIMDGDLDELIEAMLKGVRRGDNSTDGDDE